MSTTTIWPENFSDADVEEYLAANGYTSIEAWAFDHGYNYSGRSMVWTEDNLPFSKEVDIEEEIRLDMWAELNFELGFQDET